MPVRKASNGKYRIGRGPAMYRSKASAQRAYRAYLYYSAHPKAARRKRRRRSS